MFDEQTLEVTYQNKIIGKGKFIDIIRRDFDNKNAIDQYMTYLASIGKGSELFLEKSLLNNQIYYRKAKLCVYKDNSTMKRYCYYLNNNRLVPIEGIGSFHDILANFFIDHVGIKELLKFTKAVLKLKMDALLDSATILKERPPVLSNSLDVLGLAYYKLPDAIDVLPLDNTWHYVLRQFRNKDEADLFSAFIYSLFDAKDKGRQLLWLHGMGRTGKSSMINALAKFITNISVTLLGTLPNDKDAGRFTLSSIDKARVILINDNRDRLLLQQDKILRITGDDYSHIEAKQSTAKSMRLYAKIISVSNNSPIVDSTLVHETSRLIYLKFDHKLAIDSFNAFYNKHPDGKFQDMLYDGINEFIAYGRSHYNRLVDATCQLRVSETISKLMITDCSQPELAFIDMFIRNNCSKKRGEYISLNDFVDRYRTFLGKSKLSTPSIQAIQRYLMDNQQMYEVDYISDKANLSIVMYFKNTTFNKGFVSKKTAERKMWGEIITEDMQKEDEQIILKPVKRITKKDLISV